MKKIFKPLFALCGAMLLTPNLAACNNEPKNYQVLFKNYDNSILYQANVKEGESAVYVGDDPTRLADDHYQYVFSGWDKPLTNITQDTTFVAQYEKTNDYVVNFYTYDGTNLTLLQRSFVKNGDSVTYSGETPTKKADFDYYYTFKEWDKSFDKITSNLDVFATYDAISNVKDFNPNYDFWIYKFTDELDESNCSFKRASDGLTVELVKPVIVDGKEVTSHHVNFTEMEIDLSNVNKDKVGEYETTITYRGISKKEVIDVIPDSSKFEDVPVNHFSDGGVKNVAGPDWINVVTMDFYRYKDGDDEEYTVINGSFEELYLHDYFEKDDKRYMSFYRIYNGVSENVIYKLRYVGGGSESYLAEYDFPGHESEVGKVTIVKGDKERQLALHQELDDAASAYGQLEETVYHSTYTLAVKYDYDKEKKTLKIHQQDYPNIFVFDEADGKFHYQY
ncbi:MAG: hypothetical protein SPL75_02440 [Bacilli bacterium]|nr:hypothetical protein [Bacilli bacterium]